MMRALLREVPIDMLSAVLMSLSLIPILPNAPRADIIPAGMRSIAVEARIDLGPFADHVVLAYVVKPGDTLSSIAKEQLGSAKRWEEIVALSPGLDPQKLVVGQALLLPPRTAPAEGEQLLFAYYDPGQGVRRSAVALPVGEALPAAPRRGHLRLYLVPASTREQFTAAFEQRDAKTPWDHVRQLIDDGKLTFLDVTTPSVLIEKSSPAKRRSDLYRIEQEKDAAPVLRLVSSESFDAEGKPIAPVAEEHKQEKRDMLMLLLLGGIGGSGLLVLVLRRRELAQRARECALA